MKDPYNNTIKCTECNKKKVQIVNKENVGFIDIRIYYKCNCCGHTWTVLYID